MNEVTEDVKLKLTPAQQQFGNKNAVGNKGGRPLKFKDPAAFDQMVDDFFADCELNGGKPTIERLAVYMGAHRETISEYEDRPEFSDSVKKAKQKCLDWLVSAGLEARNPAMHIFLAKNNYGYKDKHETDVNLAGGVTIKWEE
jgi:hypothetical protein